MGLFQKALASIGFGLPKGNITDLEAGALGRRLAKFRPGTQHVNELVKAAGPTAMARARWLVRNNEYAGNAVEEFIASLVGDGIKPSWLVQDGALKKQGQEAFLTWTDESDSDGLSDFYGQQALVASELMLAGECFVRLRDRRPEDGLSVPLQLQVLPSEMLDVTDYRVTANGNVIKAGIEFDGIGRRVAYHFWREHPGESTTWRRTPDASLKTIVPAERVLHIIDGVESGQIRGLTRFARAIRRLFVLDEYDGAELDRKKIAALYAGFIVKPSPESGDIDAEDQGDGTGIASLEPGMMNVLLPGEDIRFSEPADVGGGYEPFQYRTLLAVAAGLGVPYMALTGDMVRANYSNQRAALISYRRRISRLQNQVMIYQLCRPVWNAWLTAAVLAGRIPVRDLLARRLEYQRVRWIPPRWDWVDPKKDLEAEILAVDNLLKARSDVIESMGYDAEETDARIKADQEREEALDLRRGGKIEAAPEPPPEVPDQQETAA